MSTENWNYDKNKNYWAVHLPYLAFNNTLDCNGTIDNSLSTDSSRSINLQ